jgi:hypothetical protein
MASVVIAGDTSGTCTLQANAAAGTTVLDLPTTSGTLVATGGAPSFTTVTTGLGNAAAPSITFTGDTNTGIFSPTADTIAFTEGGTEAMRINSSGGVQVLNCLGVGNATPSTSGAGITFPASQSASSDANTLDDYEEGTWTPTVSGSSSAPSSITYNTRTGKYTKIGNVVYLSFRLTFSFSGGSGNALVTGLPFTSSSNNQPKGTLQQDNISYTGYTYLEMGADSGVAYLSFGKNRSAAGAAGVQLSDFNTGYTDINGGFFYFV